MKTALLINAVDPLIGGVLIRGYKGTGKSTAARALAGLLPEIEVVEGCPFNSHPVWPWTNPGVSVAAAAAGQPARTVRRPMPFVELPLNATEDRLAGTLHIEKALASGVRQFEPGLLAAANRGLLYVDEVNLLDDHLVDLLLDAAASGVNVVEREGFSFKHPARFLLIGTMNPEEGELRPQFLDRFGLCAAVENIGNLEDRELIVRRRLDFESNPTNFAAQWEADEKMAGRQIRIARERLATIQVPDDLLRRAVELAHRLMVQGHRADLTTIKAARAHAALLEKDAVDWTDLCEAARLALPHRLGGSSLDTSEQIQEKIYRALREAAGEELPRPEPKADEATADDWEAMAESVQIPGSHAAGSILFEFLKKKRLKPSTMPTSA